MLARGSGLLEFSVGHSRIREATGYLEGGSGMKYEDPRKARPQPEQARQSRQASTPAVAPGKRTLTMRPPLRGGSGPAPVQRTADPEAEAARREKARSLDAMLAMAVRPDLGPGEPGVHDARQSSESTNTVEVRPRITPVAPAAPGTPGRPARSAHDAAAHDPAAHAGSAVHGSREGMAPEQSDDLKRNYLAASTPVANDLTPTGSSGLTEIRMSDLDIQGEVYEDTGHWKIRVTAAATRIHWGISTSGYRTPSPTDGGNITAGNWQEVVRELEGYEARQAAGAWHHPDASTAHELDHVSWYQGEIASTWVTIERQIQSHVLGATGSMNRAAAEQAMHTFLGTKKHDWFNAYGLAPEPRAYRVGQQVLNRIIGQIRAYARSKGWGAPDAGTGP
jgi:hypothetical protein